MKYNIHHISVLIDLMLIKAGETKDYSGLKILSEKIEDEIQLGKKTEKQHEYIYGIVNEKIKDAQLKDQSEISIKVEYLNEYLEYLDFESYDSFSNRLKTIQQLLSALTSSAAGVTFLIPLSKKKNLSSHLKEIVPFIDRLQYTIDYYDDGESNWEQKLSEKSREEIIVWFISSGIYLNQEENLKNWLLKQKENPTIITYWVTDKNDELVSYTSIINSEEPIKGKEDHQDLVMLMLLISKHQQKRKSEPPAPTILDTIKTSTPIKAVLGAILILICAYLLKGVLPSSSQITGKILFGSRPLENAIVNLPQFDSRIVSDQQGEFTIKQEIIKSGVDSLLINIQANGVDTSFYWNTISEFLTVNISDTLTPISRALVEKLILERVRLFDKVLKGNFLKWNIGIRTDLNDLLRQYSSFENKKARYRNEFQFLGLDQRLEYRKNLLAAGISQVRTYTPYERHYFDSCSIFILNTQEFPNYVLEYLMSNELPIKYEIEELQYHNRDHYTATIAFQQNIRAIRVLLECSNKTSGYKIRQTEVHGFLPEERYVLKFRQGKWSIT